MSDRLARTLASRVRAERRRRGLSLRALAARCSLSTTTVYQLEAGRGSPSLATLHTLASTLGVALPSLFAEEGGTSAQGPARRRSARGAGSRPLDRLAAGLPGQLLHGLVVTLAPGETTGPEPMRHSGQELVFGLEGTCVYEVAGRGYSIRPGDSVVVDSRRPHRARNRSRRAARILIVLYAPELPPGHGAAVAAAAVPRRRRPRSRSRA